MAQQENLKYRKTVSAFGCLFIVLGLILNQWTIGRLFTPDGVIETKSFIKTVQYFQVFLAFIGMAILALRNSLARWLQKLTITKKDIFFTLVIFAACFVLLEILARIWLFSLAPVSEFSKYALFEEVKPINRRYGPHHYLNYSPTPNYVSLDGLSRHNSLGYRGKEVKVPKPKEVFRIAILGGSTTYSTGVNDDKYVFTTIMEDILKKYGYDNVEVVNAGVPGYNSYESLINLEFRVLDLQPDLVMIYHATNDVHARMINPKSYRGDNSGFRIQWTPPQRYIFEKSVFLRILNIHLKLLPFDRNDLHHFTERSASKKMLMEEGYNEALEGTPMETLKRNPPVYFRRNLNNMVAIARENGAQIALVTWAWSPLFGDHAATAHYQEGYREHNQIIREVASSHNIPLFDFVSLMPQDIKYWTDSRHENEEGSVIKAEQFAKYLHESGLITKGK